ncbi:hypothetical protein HNO91_08060 [Pseudomonas corrugata]|uniref:Uncharacterized protein n=1 Tax=Pseudomonas corrugata TaxID=47879 RepID=A0A7Y5Z3R3_9PSED|nr:hypothetical protein [Pseudomonas corrugata]NUT86371.1 hypothetical protein [Pseudomonas corrugata]
MNAKQEVANIDRERARGARVATAPLAGLPPRFPDEIISETDPRVYVDKLLPGGRLPVTLDRWPNEDDTDKATVSIAKEESSPVWEEVDSFTPGDVVDRPSEYVAYIPADKLTDYNPAGTPSNWLVKYEAGPPLGNPWESTYTRIEIDRRAHYQANPGGAKARPPVPVVNPAIPPNNTIDDTYVNSLPNGIMEITVGTDNWAAGDQCYLYISNDYSMGTPDAPINPSPYALPQDGVFNITGTILRTLTSQTSYLFYRHVDAVGNESNLSTAKGVKVEFAPPPVLEDPIVPLASSQTDRLIDLKDCAEPGGVTVEVDRVDNVEVTDDIKLEWNTTTVDTKPFGAATKLVFSVPFSVIHDDYYAGGPATEGDIPVNVKATLLRGPSAVSVSSVDIFSNLYVAGPTDPTDPGQPNDQLNAPDITSTTVPNIIEMSDYGDDQTITINLWNDPDKPVKDGQQIKAEYAGVRLLDIDFLSAGQTVSTLTLPWSVINGAGLGAKPLQYFVSEIGGLNENPSLIQTVTNNAMVVDLDPPSINVGTSSVLLCKHLDRINNFKAVVKIPGNPVHLQLGREVTLHAQGYRDAGYTQLSPNTDFTSAAPHLIVGTEPVDGFFMDIEYDPYIRDIPEPPPSPVVPGQYVGYWKVWYSVEIGGTAYPSDEFEIPVNLVNALGEYCEQA